MSKTPTNNEILDAIQKHLIASGVDIKRARKIILSMSSEDLTCYYEEKCKKEA